MMAVSAVEPLPEVQITSDSYIMTFHQGMIPVIDLEYFSLLWTLTTHENPTHTIQVLRCMFYAHTCVRVRQHAHSQVLQATHVHNMHLTFLLLDHSDRIQRGVK